MLALEDAFVVVDYNQFIIRVTSSLKSPKNRHCYNYCLSSAQWSEILSRGKTCKSEIYTIFSKKVLKLKKDLMKTPENLNSPSKIS